MEIYMAESVTESFLKKKKKNRSCIQIPVSNTSESHN